MFPSNGSKRIGNKRKRVGSAVCFSNVRHENSVTQEDKHFKVNDRRINASFVEETANPVGMYELLKLWVQDDPEKCLKVANGLETVVGNREKCKEHANRSPAAGDDAGKVSGAITTVEESGRRVVEVQVSTDAETDPKELLKAHVLNFKVIKQQKVNACVAKVEEAIAEINKLRSNVPDSE
jgi:hypothetical protein